MMLSSPISLLDIYLEYLNAVPIDADVRGHLSSKKWSGGPRCNTGPATMGLCCRGGKDTCRMPPILKLLLVEVWILF